MRKNQSISNFDLVVVDIEVVGRAENGDERWEARRLGFPVHSITGILRLVRPNNTQEAVVLQKVAARRVTATLIMRSD